MNETKNKKQQVTDVKELVQYKNEAKVRGGTGRIHLLA